MEIDILVDKAKKGDKESLVKLIMNQEKDYYRLAYAYLGNRDDSLDALEDMIVKLYENIGRLKRNDSFYSWSKTILVNSCKKILKDRKKTVSLEVVEESRCEGGIEQNERKVLVEKYLSELGEKYQEVIRLRFFLDMEYKDVADMLKLPVGTVKSRIFYGIGKLKEKFGGDLCE